MSNVEVIIAFALQQIVTNVNAEAAGIFPTICLWDKAALSTDY
jgi:hypothetical protein